MEEEFDLFDFDISKVWTNDFVVKANKKYPNA
jgi:hypothetical protein